MTEDRVPALLARAAELLAREFEALPGFQPERQADSDAAAIAAVLEETAHWLGDNYPYFHPLYAGQMLKPPHPVARAAYALAMSINPNNHARDGGRASSAMEIEAVAEIARMFGWNEYLGHLTSGGTIANLEALWVAGQTAEKAPGARTADTNRRRPSRRTTHISRISAVLKLRFDSVPTDAQGRMRLDALEDELRKGDVATVVATLGTTAIGAVDPLPEILQLQREIWLSRARGRRLWRILQAD